MLQLKDPLSRRWGKYAVRAVSLCVFGCALVANGQAVTPSPQRQGVLIHLLRNDCGACHGLRLTGGLGPTLRPEALREKPVANLAQVILEGRPGTPMPGWKEFISAAEAQWLAQSLKQGLPDEM